MINDSRFSGLLTLFIAFNSVLYSCLFILKSYFVSFEINLAVFGSYLVWTSFDLKRICSITVLQNNNISTFVCRFWSRSVKVYWFILFSIVKRVVDASWKPSIWLHYYILLILHKKHKNQSNVLKIQLEIEDSC